ncbi:site-specific integrase [Riemerella anatipestifer]|uniref:site-specific integrase n=1 Tax=Riemerella anatipestifer TaxID=34085 RepID=UPI001BDA3AD1|nr:site-specific integrase [Riemerella anatipestifer]MBT0549579.1 site-specific integrase [Riemerella anatipestifer]MBT0556489.1 site-specific integrase [Riemerella anatipestifer]MBT0560393.1 site-specific integrase [Riemerella anatipestifer]NAV16840.1 site-specific integrase [Riemerella anatipestifer]
MTTYSLNFFLKKSKGSKQNTLIYARITVNGKRSEFSTGINVSPDNWNSSKGKINGNSALAKSANITLDNLRVATHNAYNNLLTKESVITSEAIRNQLLGVEERKITVVEVFQDHNDKMKSLIGKSFSKGTWKRYNTSLNHTIKFMQWKYNVSDMPVDSINPDFINSYDFWLRTVRNCDNNSTVKYIKNFQKIINICIANEWISKNPFLNYKSKIEAVTPHFLTSEQLSAVHSKTFRSERLSIIRDLFIFSCYTGLAYIDLKNLTKENFSVGMDGALWLKTQREKTKVAVSIPMLEIPLQILKKYENHLKCINTSMVLPVPSNQKMNEYLKEISALCDLDFDLTFHTARHTFATTVTLSNGVPLETVSKMLGHTNIRMTQHYAKVLDNKIGTDMQMLREKLSQSKNTAKKLG